MTIINSYARDGIVFPIPVLTAEEVTSYRGFAEEHLARDVDDTRRLHLDHEWAHALATHPAVVSPVEKLLGDDVVIWGTLLLRKLPHSDDYVAWHQDGAYSEFVGDDSISAWVALGASTVESGCMRVIPGSHRARLAHIETADGNNLLLRRQTVGVPLDDSGAVDVILRAGEMSLHHLDLVHGSAPNRSAAARTGFIVRFVRRSGAGTWSPLVPVRRSV